MKARSLTLVALIAISFTSPALAQYKTRCTDPAPLPWPETGPGPVTSGFFLGVYTTTVPVGGGGLQLNQTYVGGEGRLRSRLRISLLGVSVAQSFPREAKQIGQQLFRPPVRPDRRILRERLR